MSGALVVVSLFFSPAAHWTDPVGTTDHNIRLFTFLTGNWDTVADAVCHVIPTNLFQSQ